MFWLLFGLALFQFYFNVGILVWVINHHRRHLAMFGPREKFRRGQHKKDRLDGNI